jgi:hypothetical protein
MPLRHMTQGKGMFIIQLAPPGELWEVCKLRKSRNSPLDAGR